jgi:formamidopyrimidine-DNA glycosylase
MPEIVELRTDADLLDFYLSGRLLKSAELIPGSPFAKNCEGLEELSQCLPMIVDRVRSRAKKLIIYLVDPAEEHPDHQIVISYGMTGRIGEAKKEHSHVRFEMSHSWVGFDTFFYSNVRRFSATVKAFNDPSPALIDDFAAPICLGYPGEDGLEPITEAEFYAAVKACNGKSLASALMDQHSICSGIGRYLLCDILYHAKINPWIKCGELTTEIIGRLWSSANTIIWRSYELGGNSIEDYVHVDGTLGDYASHRLVYGREGEEDKNGEIIRREKGPSGILHFVDSQRGLKD